MLIAIFYKDIYRLGARDGFIQPIIIERFDLQFINWTKWIKKTVVNCDITG